jgi:hypothetical protein
MNTAGDEPKAAFVFYRHSFPLTFLVML